MKKVIYFLLLLFLISCCAVKDVKYEVEVTIQGKGSFTEYCDGFKLDTEKRTVEFWYNDGTYEKRYFADGGAMSYTYKDYTKKKKEKIEKETKKDDFLN